MYTNQIYCVFLIEQFECILIGNFYHYYFIYVLEILIEELLFLLTQLFEVRIKKISYQKFHILIFKFQILNYRIEVTKVGLYSGYFSRIMNNTKSNGDDESPSNMLHFIFTSPKSFLFTIMLIFHEAIIVP